MFIYSLKNFGISSPVNKCRSTPDSSIVAIRITPPELPSREIARASAIQEIKVNEVHMAEMLQSNYYLKHNNNKLLIHQLTIFSKFNAFFF